MPIHLEFNLVQQHDDHQIYRARVSYPLTNDIGQWLIEHELFASGNDFTGERFEDPNAIGISRLKRVWGNEDMKTTEGANGLDLLLMVHNNKPVGIAAWLHTHHEQNPLLLDIPHLPDHPLHKPKKAMDAVMLGQVMVYLKKAYRGQGWVKKALEHNWVNEWHTWAAWSQGQGRLPLLTAVDASANMIEQISSVPCVADMTLCQRLRRQTWRLWEDSLIHSGFEWPFHKWMINPRSLEPPKPQRMKMR